MDRFSEAQRRQWSAFMRASHPEINAQAAQLMDDFRLVSHQIYRLSDMNLEESGLSYAQYRVLMSLRFNEWTGQCDGLNPSEISAKQGTSRNTISSLIRSLEENGLIERQLDMNDRRRFNIHLSEAGREKMIEQSNDHIELINQLFAVLSTEEMEVLSTLLQKLSQRAATLKE
ncbi:MAG: MarR family transcriptional regulator [Anaerolineales bacterium]|uniref:MarR family winged helix-turn-helix transcriptional regulator n=1 Tax=Promineifilum sp. TaxID=2664178 RepID=UPI001D4270F4|nr:MarR family transcriptional regulator [Anaerolineales bacterium]MCB8936189.1 MarR family transcriptional regulator [Promineifilum sp.]MCO5178649.1 MarR family transcriptional regulator [Promineifilum sp.]